MPKQSVPLLEIIESSCKISEMQLERIQDALRRTGNIPLDENQTNIVLRMIIERGIQGMMSGYSGAGFGFDLSEVMDCDPEKLTKAMHVIYPDSQPLFKRDELAKINPN